MNDASGSFVSFGSESRKDVTYRPGLKLVNALDALAKTAAEDLQCESVFMSVIHEDVLHSLGVFPSLAVEDQGRRHKPWDTVCARTARHRATLVVDDAREEPTLADIPYVRDGRIVGDMGLPLHLGADRSAGSICAISLAPRHWENLELSYLRQVARSVELMLLNEIGRLEAESASLEVSELDGMLAALSARATAPVSIYTGTGEMVFASAALLARVQDRFVAGYWRTAGAWERAVDRQDSARSESRAQIVHAPTPEGRTKPFRVASSHSVSGLIVCTWSCGLSVVS